MADRYAGHAVGVASGAAKALWNLISAATVRPRLYDIIVGTVATPADLAVLFAVIRTTAVGTEGSGFTPTALDPGSPASLCDIGVGVFGAEPTKTANSEVLHIPMNQRASFRWVAAPGGELIAPATADNGLCLQTESVSSGTTAYDSSLHWNE